MANETRRESVTHRVTKRKSEKKKMKEKEINLGKE